MRIPSSGSASFCLLPEALSGRSLYSASGCRLVAIRAGRTLVTNGPYRVIRHPGYLGLLVNSLGWALVFRSGVGGARVADHSPLLARIRAEETSLPTQFDGEYDICCARTSRQSRGTMRVSPGLRAPSRCCSTAAAMKVEQTGGLDRWANGPVSPRPNRCDRERMTRPEKAHRLIAPSDGFANSPDPTRLQLQ